MIPLIITIKGMLAVIFYTAILYIGIVTILKLTTTKLKYYLLLRAILIVLWIVLNYHLYWEKIIKI